MSRANDRLPPGAQKKEEQDEPTNDRCNRQADSPQQPSLSQHLYIAVPIILVMLAVVWFATCGDWRVSDPEVFGQFFDVQAASLLQGHWDVPHGGIGFEAFIHDGKFYGYFGFIPALARIPLNFILPTMRGCWSRSAVIAGCFVTLVYSYRILLAARRHLGLSPLLGRGARLAYCGFILTAGLGSTLIFLSSRCYIYHEAIIWGAVLALACYDHMLRYLTRPTGRGLLCCCLLCFCCFFTRASVGSGTVAAVMMLFLNLFASRTMFGRSRKREPLLRVSRWLRCWPTDSIPPWRHVLATAATVAAVLAVYVTVNQARFGTFFDGMPFKLYNQVALEPSGERLARTHGSAVSWANVRTDAAAYFSITSIRIFDRFPWVGCAVHARIFPESRFDIVEPFSSLTASMPALTLLCAAGIPWARKTPGGRGTVAEGPATHFQEWVRVQPSPSWERLPERLSYCSPRESARGTSTISSRSWCSPAPSD